MDILLLLVSGKHNVQRQLWRQVHGLEWRPTVTVTQFHKAVSKLKKNGWIEKKKIEDGIYYSVTREGKMRQLLHNLKTFSRNRAKQSTIAIFDIPEEKRTYRNAIRRLLKQMDFTMLQRSVFITPYELPESFYNYLRELKLLNYFLFIEGKMQTKI